MAGVECVWKSMRAQTRGATEAFGFGVVATGDQGITARTESGSSTRRGSAFESCVAPIKKKKVSPN